MPMSSMSDTASSSSPSLSLQNETIYARTHARERNGDVKRGVGRHMERGNDRKKRVTGPTAAIRESDRGHNTHAMQANRQAAITRHGSD